MIAPVCNRCNQEITEFGGLLFSPPSGPSLVVKKHLCVACYEVVSDEIDMFPHQHSWRVEGDGEYEDFHNVCEVCGVDREDSP